MHCTVSFSQKMSQTTKEVKNRKQRLKKKVLKHLENQVNTVISLYDQRLHGKNAEYCFYKWSYPYVQTHMFVKVTRDPLLFKQLFIYTNPRHLKLDQSFRRDSFIVYLCLKKNLFYFLVKSHARTWGCVRHMWQTDKQTVTFKKWHINS